MSTKAFHEEQVRLACRDKIAAEKRQAACMLMFEAAAVQSDHAQQEHERDRARTYLDMALDAAARAQEHCRLMMDALE